MQGVALATQQGSFKEVGGRLVVMISVNPRSIRSHGKSEKLGREHEKRIPVNPSVGRSRDSGGCDPNVPRQAMLQQEVEE